jgi:4-alpha-glucanotransferase
VSGPFSERSSGVLLHLTSLPGPHGSGDLGPAAHGFAEFLAQAGQRHWQMLPVVPPGGGNSPYDSPSAFAGSPWLVSLELLADHGLLDAADLVAPERLRHAPRTLHGASRHFRERRLKKAFARFQARPSARQELEHTLEANRTWLGDHALFCALKRAHGGKPWTAWPPELARREPLALEHARRQLATDFEFEIFVQGEFARQWRSLRAHCHDLGLKLLGDLPMFVAHDAADVWANQGLFQLHPDGQKRVVAGVPPAYFSADRPHWG